MRFAILVACTLLFSSCSTSNQEVSPNTKPTSEKTQSVQTTDPALQFIQENKQRDEADKKILIQARRESNFSLCDDITPRTDNYFSCFNSYAVKDINHCDNITNSTPGRTAAKCRQDIAILHGDLKECIQFDNNDIWQPLCEGLIEEAQRIAEDYFSGSQRSIASDSSYCKIERGISSIHPRFMRLQSLGELFTANACGEEKVETLYGSYYSKGSIISLYQKARWPDFAHLRSVLLEAGYYCIESVRENECSHWQLEKKTSVSTLLKLEPFISAIESERCLNCTVERQMSQKATSEWLKTSRSEGNRIRIDTPFSELSFTYPKEWNKPLLLAEEGFTWKIGIGPICKGCSEGTDRYDYYLSKLSSVPEYYERNREQGFIENVQENTTPLGIRIVYDLGGICHSKEALLIRKSDEVYKLEARCLGNDPEFITVLNSFR